MKPLHLAAALALVALPAGAWAYYRQRQAVAPAALAPPAPEVPVTAPAATGAALVEESSGPAPSAGLGSALQLGGKLLGGASVGATIGAGLAVTQLQANVVGALGGSQAAQDTVRVFGPTATLATLTQMGTAAVAKELGFSDGAAKDVAQVVSGGTVAGLVLGAPAAVGVAITKGIGEAASAAVGAILGDKAEAGVRNAASQLDPFKSGSVANQVVSAIAGAVFGGLVPDSPPPGGRQDTRDSVDLERVRTLGRDKRNPDYFD